MSPSESFSVALRRAIRSFVRGGLRYVFGKRGQRRVHGLRLFNRLKVEWTLRGRNSLANIAQTWNARLWVDREAFPRIFKLIKRAKHSIVMQMFIWKDDELGRKMVRRLVKMADRGVQVDITKESVGDFFELHQDFLSTQQKDDALWKRFWNHPNIAVHHGTNHDHAKVFIIDGRILLLTGMNVANEYHEEWHDYMVELRGIPFVEQYLSHGAIPHSKRNTTLVVNSENRKDIRSTVMRLLSSARRSIVVEHPYLADPKVLQELAKKTHEGIRVTVILPSRPDFHYYTNMQSVSELLQTCDQRHLRMFMFPGMVHGKVMLIDKEVAFIGSANLMTSSLDHMGEVNVLVRGRDIPVVSKLRDVLRIDVLRSEPLMNTPGYSWLWRWLSWFQL